MHFAKEKYSKNHSWKCNEINLNEIINESCWAPVICLSAKNFFEEGKSLQDD